MATITNEEDLINEFVKAHSKKHKNAKYNTNTGNHSKGMDVEIYDGTTTIALEAKNLSDSSRSAGEFHKIFGQILKGRKLCCNKKGTEYGFLFDNEQRETVIKYFKEIEYTDLIKFFTDYDVKHIFFYDSVTEAYQDCFAEIQQCIS